VSSARILQGDCRWYMQRFGCHVDAIVTDPPYELGFMGKAWDRAGVAFDPRTWKLALQVLKPGGRLLAFGAPRTHHRIWCAIEDAGFVIEDTVSWLFGSGFPKHKSKLKPFAEFICVARKGPVTALNIDAGRIPTSDVLSVPQSDPHRRGLGAGEYCISTRDTAKMHQAQQASIERTMLAGRWPPNVAMDESAAEMLDAQTGTLTSGTGSVKRASAAERNGNRGAAYGRESRPEGTPMIEYGDSGGASRFLYVAKASRAERERGLAGMPLHDAGKFEDDAYEWATDGRGNPRAGRTRLRNPHPTVKPVALMRWLVKLVTQPGDLVLDPFAGSGTTGMACVLEGREFIGIEREPEYAAIAERRIANALGPLFADTDGAA
jgi:site-specific DNA-methyltransferase (adenine-specific)